MKSPAFRFVLSIGATAILVFLAPHLDRLWSVEAQSSTKPTPKDNEELIRLYQEDQADRAPRTAIDWKVVGPRDQARLKRVKELYTQGRMQTGGDYYNAAMVLQHGSSPEDFLLAHEFCIVAISKGEVRAKWLAAASEDRFLMNIGRPQRFGTQYRSDGQGPIRLYEVGPSVTDGLRRALDVPSLAEAKAREAEFHKKE
ncbi:MAG: hypothetical protein P8Z74_14260 [Acidobacteriota bacterium]